MAWYDKIFNRKTPLPNPVLRPTDPVMAQLDLVQQFTRLDEPKLVDYPKGQYSAYWEIVLGEVDGGVVAAIRIYGYDGVGFIREHRITGPSCEVIKPHVNAWIIDQMNQAKR